MNKPALGCTKDQLDTPALCLDLDALEANIAKMAATCRDNNMQWRPHTKCHKSPIIAKKLLAAGALGMTCAKLGEAEVMAAGGVTDILIANLIVGPIKVKRLVELRRIADPIVCIDHIDQAQPIAAAMAEAGLTLRVIIEVDLGLARVGTLPGEPTLELARRLAATPGLTLAGIMGYEGHLLMLEDPDDKATQIRAALTVLTETAEAIRQEGIPCEIVSCGGTGSFYYSVLQPGITELQAGGGIFMDVFYRFGCQIEGHEHAMTVLTTVVGRPAAERAIIDAGRKTMNMEVDTPRVWEDGKIREDITIDSLSAEHGKLKLEPSAQGLKIGDHVEFLPGYSDLTAVLHNDFYVFRGGKLEAIWPLEGRGRLQ